MSRSQSFFLSMASISEVAQFRCCWMNSGSRDDPHHKGNCREYHTQGFIATDQLCSQTLQPADQAIRERHRFRQKLQGLLKSKHIVTTKTELEQQIKRYERDQEYLKEQAFDAITYAANDNTRYQNDRMKGRNKVGRLAQEFLTSFAEFFKAYSGVVELLKGAGQVYGTVAYETLSILFIVRDPNID